MDAGGTTSARDYPSHLACLVMREAEIVLRYCARLLRISLRWAFRSNNPFAAILMSWSLVLMLRSISDSGSITRVVHSLRVGNEDAVAKLWEKYFGRMVQVAFSKLGRHPGRSVDAEDVALSAFGHFCRDVAEGSFPWIKDRQSLWPVLVTITARRAARLSRDELRQKRSALRRDGRQFQSLDLVSRALPPDESMLLDEQVEILLNSLDTPLLREVAKLKMEGMTNGEVAVELGIAVRSVERKLNLIRQIWTAKENE